MRPNAARLAVVMALAALGVSACWPEQGGLQHGGQVKAVLGGGPALIDDQVVPHALRGHGPQQAGRCRYVPCLGEVALGVQPCDDRFAAL